LPVSTPKVGGADSAQADEADTLQFLAIRGRSSNGLAVINTGYTCRSPGCLRYTKAFQAYGFHLIANYEDEGGNNDYYDLGKLSQP